MQFKWKPINAFLHHKKRLIRILNILAVSLRNYSRGYDIKATQSAINQSMNVWNVFLSVTQWGTCSASGQCVKTEAWKTHLKACYSQLRQTIHIWTQYFMFPNFQGLSAPAKSHTMSKTIVSQKWNELEWILRKPQGNSDYVCTTTFLFSVAVFK